VVSLDLTPVNAAVNDWYCTHRLIGVRIDEISAKERLWSEWKHFLSVSSRASAHNLVHECNGLHCGSSWTCDESALVSVISACDEWRTFS
jgi:hypothetical protein